MDTYPEFKMALVSDVPLSGVVRCAVPSNIALVKYWGKKDIQIPQNPSISFTLDVCKTETTIAFAKKDNSNTNENYEFEFFFEGKLKPDFEPKIKAFFERIGLYVPFLKEYILKIETFNTFPHSSGIASSASGMGALAYGLMLIEKKINPNLSESKMLQKASFLARLGSGSACRSIEGPMTVWGQHNEIANSSDLYAVKVNEADIHPFFQHYQDTILLIDTGQKEVSSTVGHNLMHGHPYAIERFKQASENLNLLKKALIEGDADTFIKIVESEALTLHAMMMTSMPYFILMKPNTLSAIEKIWEYRKAKESKVCFTLDAGANIHLLYPEYEKEQILDFINNELVVYCDNGQYICDKIGLGAIIL